MYTFPQRRYVFIISTLLLVSLVVKEQAKAGEVEDVLTLHLNWRAAHPVTKARIRVLGREGTPVGRYYLDLRSASRTEVSIISVLLGKAELVMRTVKESIMGYVFFNEEVYLVLDVNDLSLLSGNGGFWEAQTVEAVRDTLTSIFDIQGTVTKTVSGVTYTGIAMTLNQERWEAFRASIGADLVVALPAGTLTDVTLFFDPSGAVHALEMTAEIDVQVLFYDWTDLTGDDLAQIDDARQPPHAAQQLWDVPMDEAMLRYIARLTQ